MKKYAIVAVVLLLAVVAMWFLGFGKSATNSDLIASNARELSEDLHYRTANLDADHSTLDSNKILVQEFFWYGCPHCQSFEPAVRKYKNALPDDVELVQIPVTWNKATELHAAVHYVAMESDDPEALQDSLFEKIISIRKEGNLERHVDELEPVFAAHGISASVFRNRLKAPDIQSKVNEARALMRGAGISGTPSVMVDNAWVVLNNEAVAKAGVFNVVDHLIDMAWQAR